MARNNKIKKVFDAAFKLEVVKLIKEQIVERVIIGITTSWNVSGDKLRTL